jgi:hypothetical protein
VTDRAGEPRRPEASPREEGSADVTSRAPGPPRAGRALARTSILVTSAGLGVVVGLVGTVAHRGVPPWGLVVAVLATLCAAALARGLGQGLGLAAYGGGLLAITQLANALRPGGDVLVAADPLGYAWLTLPLLMLGTAAFLPHRWFEREQPGDRSEAP